MFTKIKNFYRIFKRNTIKIIKWSNWNRLALRLIQTIKPEDIEVVIIKPVESSSAKRVKLLSHLLNMMKPIKTNYPLIRIGSTHDGGYLVPDDMNGITACFSPGVSVNADFEYALAKKGIKCFLADYSVDTPPLEHELFCFDKKYLGYQDNLQYIKIDSWIDKYCSHQSEFILQMDIEGAEYEIINSINIDNLRKFRILIIEFHALGALLSNAITSPRFKKIYSTMEKLLKYFDIVHIHPNNYGHIDSGYGYEIPTYLEITFLRKDRASTKEAAIKFPHTLDRRNVVYHKDITLPECWYS